jgi:AcrR family transcriptional regulator
MSREYKKRKRAESEAETRERIAAAAAALHGEIGPAKTTVSAVAERAGVQRATVYRHFPDDDALFEACSSHWNARNAPPDPNAWAAIEDPAERLRVALAELYDWYARTEYMLAKLFRDQSLVPAVAKQLGAYRFYVDASKGVLMAGRRVRGARRRRTEAAIGHALAFDTWRSLVHDQELRTDEAVELVGRLAD